MASETYFGTVNPETLDKLLARPASAAATTPLERYVKENRDLIATASTLMKSLNGLPADLSKIDHATRTDLLTKLNLAAPALAARKHALARQATGDLADYFSMPQENGDSPEERFYALDREFGMSQIPEPTLRGYLVSPANTIDGKQNEGLKQGLTRAANVGRYDLILSTYLNTSFGAVNEALSGTQGPYTSASAAINKSDVLTRMNHAFNGANILESMRNVAAGAPSSQLIQLDDKEFAEVVKTFLENDGGSAEIGKALKILSASQDAHTQAYVTKFKQTAATVIAQSQNAVSKVQTKASTLINGGSHVAYEIDTTHAGYAEAFSRSAIDQPKTPVARRQIPFNQGFRHTAAIMKNNEFFDFKLKLWVEQNALGNVFSNQTELDTAVNAAKQDLRAALKNDAQPFPAVPNLSTSLILPADTKVDLNIFATKPAGAGVRKLS